MRVGIISFANTRFCPFLNVYTKILKDNNIDFDVILWNRFGLIEEIDGCNRIYSYEEKINNNKNKILKMLPMIKYSNYVKKVLKKNKYDKVIVLTSLIGVFVESYLTRKMRGRYIFDIRDYSYEHIKGYYNKMGKLMKHSALNVISSEDFKEFLPDYETMNIHNYSYVDGSKESFVKSTEQLNIAFIGVVRFVDECEKFLKTVSQDERIVFHFYGAGQEQELKEMCNSNNFKNVVFHGMYKPEEKNDIIRKTDIIYNAYGNRTNLVKYALSNKYYDALYFKRPLIVNSNTTMARKSNGICFEYDYENCTADDIVNWYNNIDALEFESICSSKFNEICLENEKTLQRIKESIIQ